MLIELILNPSFSFFSIIQNKSLSATSLIVERYQGIVLLGSTAVFCLYEYVIILDYQVFP